MVHPRVIILTALLALGLGGALAVRIGGRDVPVPACPAAVDFDAFLNGRLERSRRARARPGNEERLLRFAPRTEYAILYVHGFGASRAEGEAVVDAVARRFRFNTYYLRLPGHGTNPEDHARATARDYVREAGESLCAMSALGEKVIVVGTSMGGLLATLLAERYPDRVDAVVLASPFFDYAAELGRIVDALPAPTLVARLFVGPVRKTGPRPGDPRERRLPGYEAFWYTDQLTESLGGLIELRRFVERRATLSRITAPFLLLYHYRTEDDQDGAASVPAMLTAFSRLGRSGEKQALKRAVPIRDGSHVLMSRFVRADHALVEREIADFVEAVRRPPVSRADR